MAAAPPRLQRQGTIYITGGKTERITKHYRIGKRIGKPGQYGEARIATNKETKEKFAVKILNKARYHHIDNVESIWEDMKNEITIMRELDHPNVVKFVDVYEDKKKLHIVMELCTGKELFDRVTECPAKHFTEAQAADIAAQMFEGIKFLHDNHIVHCDIKPDNFLFSGRELDSTLKIIDFGMSKRLPRFEKLEVLCGTPYYIAPEVLEKQFTNSADMWSIGVVLFVMLFGFPPFFVDNGSFGKKEQNAIYRKIKKGFNPTVKRGYGAWFPKAMPVSAQAMDLVGNLLKKNPAERLTAAECLDHPWIRNRNNNSNKLPETIINSMRRFVNNSAFKNVVCEIFREKIHPQQVEAVGEVFKAFDTNGDGKITMQEFLEGMKTLSEDANEDVLTRYFQHVDLDSDGFIFYEELLVAATHEHLRAKDERLWETFCLLDKDDDGFITVEELQDAIRESGETDQEKIDQAVHFVAEADMNDDGVIDYEEFLAALYPDVNNQETPPRVYQTITNVMMEDDDSEFECESMSLSETTKIVAEECDDNDNTMAMNEDLEEDEPRTAL